MRRNTFLAAVVLAALAGSAPVPAMACPLCKLANESKQATEEENLRPRAYMYSILFMLSMPFMLTTGFSIAFYRVWKQGQLALAAAEEADLANGDRFGATN
jgi:hypothetical protein